MTVLGGPNKGRHFIDRAISAAHNAFKIKQNKQSHCVARQLLTPNRCLSLPMLGLHISTALPDEEISCQQVRLNSPESVHLTVKTALEMFKSVPRAGAPTTLI